MKADPIWHHKRIPWRIGDTVPGVNGVWADWSGRHSLLIGRRLFIESHRNTLVCVPVTVKQPKTSRVLPTCGWFPAKLTYRYPVPRLDPIVLHRYFIRDSVEWINPFANSIYSEVGRNIYWLYDFDVSGCNMDGVTGVTWCKPALKPDGTSFGEYRMVSSLG